jgi:hypothetical protein
MLTITQTSKVLNYLDSPIVVPYFVFFVGTWVYLRHYHNLRFLFSMLPLHRPFPDPIMDQVNQVSYNLYTTGRTFLDPILIHPFSVLFPQTASMLGAAMSWLHVHWNMPSQFESVGSFTINWVTQQYKCWISQWIAFSLLSALQALNLVWLFFICRSLWRAVVTLGATREDERSVYDSDEEREADDEGQEKPVFVDTGKSSAQVVGEVNGNGLALKH